MNFNLSRHAHGAGLAPGLATHALLLGLFALWMALPAHAWRPAHAPGPHRCACGPSPCVRRPVAQAPRSSAVMFSQRFAPVTQSLFSLPEPTSPRVAPRFSQQFAPVASPIVIRPVSPDAPAFRSPHAAYVRRPLTSSTPPPQGLILIRKRDGWRRDPQSP